MIRENKHWNSSNLASKDTVVTNLCSQADIKKAVDKANRKIERQKKEANKESQKAEENESQKTEEKESQKTEE